VDIDMGHYSLLPDMRLSVTEGATPRALKLNKGDRISFCGIMNQQPGSWFAMELADATIP
jgi:hypothetical protein